MIISDYLIIGIGIAGLSLALKASKNGVVSLITKKKLFDSATGKAQGGIACVTDKSDSFEAHARIRWFPEQVFVMKKWLRKWLSKVRKE